MLAYVRSVHHQLFTQAQSLFGKLNYGSVDLVLWQLVPYQLQNFLELIDVLRLGLK